MKYTVKVKIVEYEERVVEAESVDDAMDMAFDADVIEVKRCDDEYCVDVVQVTDENGKETAVGW